MSELSYVKLIDLFEIIATIQDDKINFEISSKDNPQAIPFIGRTSSNNGIVDYVLKREGYLNSPGNLTISLDGSTGSVFYQHVPFSSGQNIWQLIPRDEKFKEFNSKIGIFFATSIEQAVVNYSYNLSLTKSRLMEVEILAPTNEDGCIDIDYIENRMSKIRNIDITTNAKTARIF
tara:strand:- start:134 stop:661 length:528 start_codon:yes stop_codon:yes gene_type:complete